MENLTVVVPFYNGHEYLRGLLSSIPLQDVPVIFVDDQSDEPLHIDLPNVRVVRPDKKGFFTGAANRGILECSTDVLILNQDVTLTGDAWLNLIAELRQDHAFFGERIKGTNPAFPYGYVHGVFQFMRRDAIAITGLMDESTYPLWGASALWQWQVARRGYKVKPIEEIPGLSHHRKGRFGSSIRSFLKSSSEDPKKYVRVPPEVSVIVPAYNYGRYLEDLVNSFIGGPTSIGHMPGQTFQSFEIIIVNDASTDGTHEICQELCDPWKGIRYINLPKNRGTAGAYNAGISEALGKYITCISADDMREPWAIEKMYAAIVENPKSLVYDNIRRVANGERQEVWPLPDYDFDVLLSKNMVPTGVMFTKEAWQTVGGYPEILGNGREDWGFAIAMGQAGFCGIRLEEPGYLYRREGQNRTLRNTDPQWMEYFRAKMRSLFPDLYAGRFPMGCCGKRQSVVTKASNVSRSVQAMMANYPSGNMAAVEYIGLNRGSTRWGGKLPSGRTYVFGLNERDRIKLVEEKDLEWFLARKGEGGEALFRLAQAKSPPVVPAPVVEEPVEELSADFSKEDGFFNDSLSDDTDEISGEETIDPADYTVAQLLQMDFTQEDALVLLETEKAGKNRKMVIEYLKSFRGESS